MQDASDLLELAEEENDESTVDEVVRDLKRVSADVEQFEFQRMFAGKLDARMPFWISSPVPVAPRPRTGPPCCCGCTSSIARAMGFSAEMIDSSDGEVAGIKSATIHVTGPYAYGWLRTETGVHRLVRKSPFDSGNRRHTSFAAVFVSPEIDDDIEIEIDPSDLRVDVYRASGAGGQHVNKTESAVRMTHMPTNTVVQCQSERSQHKNRATAMKQMRAKLYELEEQKRRAEAQVLEDTKTDVGWGQQIRSYVLDQSRIKDLRTGVETGSPDKMLDGDLRKFIEASLKQGL